MISVDEYGPEEVIELYDKDFNVRSFVVIDNTALGPGKGGIRLIGNVTVEEVARLARAMTFKNALAEIPYGGAKAGIAADPGPNKPYIIRNFARMLKGVIPTRYIPGPDMNTNEYDMAIIADELGPDAVSSKPLAMGGIPHELGVTGYGVVVATEIAAEYKKIKLKGATVAIEGFGNVGTSTMQFLAEKGAKVVAVSDSKGMVYNKDGLDLEELLKVKSEKGSVRYAKGKAMDNSLLFEQDVDILIPAARGDSINEANYKKVKAQIIVEGANIPMSESIEKEFFKKGVIVVPDIIANAGGVISSWAELVHKSEKEVFGIIENKIGKNTRLILEKSKKENKPPREVAVEIARERIKSMEKVRGIKLPNQNKG